MINVTKTYLPPREKYKEYVDRIFDSGWLTNNGQFVQELERRLSEYLGVENLLLVANGTIALQVAYKALGIKGKVITTPFSFVATASSLVWEGITPVFADINKDSLNIDPEEVLKKISPDTTAILPVHVFGNAVEIDEIQRIAASGNLKVVYDAAHAFGVKYKGNSILNYGDASVLSFHSTKIFHTIEGGAIVFRNRSDYEKARLMINFGIAGYDLVTELGINGKMNEFQAAMGLCVLDDIDKIIDKRKVLYSIYSEAFTGVKRLTVQKSNPDSSLNYSYFPLIFSSEETRELVFAALARKEIFPRRYFSPSLETLPYLEHNEKVTVSDNISKTILCLPIFESLSADDQKQIIEIVLSCILIS
jgi:dTDP-4-amino-4,6-dideoxygalactose transaminase